MRLPRGDPSVFEVDDLGGDFEICVVVDDGLLMFGGQGRREQVSDADGTVPAGPGWSLLPHHVQAIVARAALRCT